MSPCAPLDTMPSPGALQHLRQQAQSAGAPPAPPPGADYLTPSKGVNPLEMVSCGTETVTTVDAMTPSVQAPLPCAVEEEAPRPYEDVSASEIAVRDRMDKLQSPVKRSPPLGSLATDFNAALDSDAASMQSSSARTQRNSQGKFGAGLNQKMAGWQDGRGVPTVAVLSPEGSSNPFAAEMLQAAARREQKRKVKDAPVLAGAFKKSPPLTATQKANGGAAGRSRTSLNEERAAYRASLVDKELSKTCPCRLRVAHCKKCREGYVARAEKQAAAVDLQSNASSSLASERGAARFVPPVVKVKDRRFGTTENHRVPADLGGKTFADLLEHLARYYTAPRESLLLVVRTKKAGVLDWYQDDVVCTVPAKAAWSLTIKAPEKEGAKQGDGGCCIIS